GRSDTRWSRLPEPAGDLIDVAIGREEVRPAVLWRAVHGPDEEHALRLHLPPGRYDIVDQEAAHRRMHELVILRDRLRTEDLEHIAIGQVEDREILLVDARDETQHVQREPTHFRVTIGRCAEPRDALDLHVMPPT